MAEQKIWQSYDELEQNPDYEQVKHNEFKEKLPFASFTMNKVKNTPRRDFLKLLGFSLSAATIAASCETPIKKAIPYVLQPEEIIPGIANYYASTFISGKDVCPILVKTRDGRPIKIDGNPQSKLTGGGSNAKIQASVISLYDSSRLKNPKYKGEDITWDEVDNQLKRDLKAVVNKGGNIVLLSSGIASPTTNKLIAEFSNELGNLQHVVFEPMSNSGMLTANEQTFGKKVIPSYDFSKADVIVSFECDFLNNWIAPVTHQAQYAKGRKVSRKNSKMSKHFQFESIMTNTGSNADYRTIVKPAHLPLAIALLHAEVVGGGANIPNNLIAGIDKRAITKAAVALKRANGKGVVVSASNDPNVQALINGINQAIGSYGSTINIDKPSSAGVSTDRDVITLVNNMEAGNVDAILIYNCNPSYSLPLANRFNVAMNKVPLTISFNPRNDESAAFVKYQLPDNHYLESWNDAELMSGEYSLAQPTIRPLFNTRQFQDSLLKWLDRDVSFYDYLKSSWEGGMASQQSALPSFSNFWDKSLHDGVFSGSAQPAPVENMIIGTTVEEAPEPTFTGNVGEAVSSLVNAAKNVSDKGTLVFYESIRGNGEYANNPFLQETPDPVTKIVWENVLLVSKKTAKARGWKEGNIVRISANNAEAELPVIFQPGMADDTYAVEIGYGRTAAGNEKFNVGANVYPFVNYNDTAGAFEYTNSNFEIKLVSKATVPVARTQTHHNINDFMRGEDKPSEYDRKEQLIREATLEDYKRNKYAGNERGKKFDDPYFYDHYMVSLYGNRKELHDGHHWGMAVDLNSCTGCNACVVACNIENNVPVVGKDEVFKAHEMHWLRIDRYYIGRDDNPTVAYQPMMCQHCDNAPCENVCPVSATNHSAEGLNQMAYNRCIGTRYCANNCPFKVRRFNWFDYQGADSFLAGTALDNDHAVSLADDLSRLVLNPDVTVRSRGVMEKCSFCVQRIQGAKLEAKKEGRKMKDGDVVTACQQACATGAISFGDMNDKESKVYKLRALNERAYNLLEDLHVLPSVGYLTKIRNVDKLGSA